MLLWNEMQKKMSYYFNTKLCLHAFLHVVMSYSHNEAFFSSSLIYKTFENLTMHFLLQFQVNKPMNFKRAPCIKTRVTEITSPQTFAISHRQHKKICLRQKLQIELLKTGWKKAEGVWLFVFWNYICFNSKTIEFSCCDSADENSYYSQNE